jgi:hypothetical protein
MAFVITFTEHTMRTKQLSNKRRRLSDLASSLPGYVMFFSMFLDMGSIISMGSVNSKFREAMKTAPLILDEAMSFAKFQQYSNHLKNIVRAKLYPTRAHDEVPSLRLWNLKVIILLQPYQAWYPDEFNFLQEFLSLQKLVLRDGRNLRHLGSLANLPCLDSLHLYNCIALSDVGPLTQLVQLQELTISQLPQVTDISHVGALTNLKKLNLTGLRAASNLLVLKDLTNLECLHLEKLPKLDNVEFIGSFQKLRTLFLCLADKDRNTNLFVQQIPLELPQLTSLTLRHSILTNFESLNICTKLTAIVFLRLPGLLDLDFATNTKELLTLKVSECNTLKDIGGVGFCTQLTRVDLQSCPGVVDVSALFCLPGLRKLALRRCSVLKVPSLPDHSKLDVLCLDYTPIKTLDLKNLLSVKLISAKHCSLLTSLGSLRQPANSQQIPLHGEAIKIVLDNCPALVDISMLLHFSVLYRLDVDGCVGLENLHGLENHEALRSFRFERCGGLTSLGAMLNCAALTTLVFYGLASLVTMEGVQGCRNLAEVSIKECGSLLRVNHVGLLMNLRKLRISNCRRLKHVDGFLHSTELITLRLRKLYSLEKITILQCYKLAQIRIQHCPSITVIKLDKGDPYSSSDEEASSEGTSSGYCTGEFDVDDY